MAAKQTGKLEKILVRSQFVSGPLLGRVVSVCVIALIVVLGACQRSGVAAEQQPLAIRAQSSERAQAASDAWRFKYHGGRWWYWLPSNSWAWHDGRQWIPYEKDHRVRTSAILVQRPARNGPPERYQSGTLPAPPETFEAMQDEVQELKQTLQRLEARLREHEAAGYPQGTGPADHPWSSADSAKLRELWRSRQAAVEFYDFNTDSYYFSGKGHFTD